MFAAAATSIMSGAIAERSDIISYLVYSTVVPGFIYPVVTHWTWDTNGWLAVLKLGSYSGGFQVKLNFLIAVSLHSIVSFQDFAGSGGVHVCGATCALAGALMLGPRASKTTNDFNMEETRGHSVPVKL